MTAKSFPPVNTQEIYDYRPGSTKVHRISEYETGEQLIPGTTPITGRHVDPPKAYAEHARKLLPSFKSCEVEGGSIGACDRLFKGTGTSSSARSWCRGARSPHLQPRWPSAPEK